MKIKRTPVKSSQIAAIGYSQSTQQLDIEFADRRDGSPGSVYRYENVTMKDYENLITAESIGRAFGQGIKLDPKRWPFRKLTEEEK